MTRWQDIATDPTPPKVRPGQVWKSTDRREDRHVRVVITDGHFAVVAGCDPNGQVHERARRTRIRIVGDVINRYRLVSQPEPTRRNP